MIKFGKLTNPGEDVIKEINKAKRQGFDYVEIGIEFPTSIKILRENKQKIAQALKDFPYQPIGHTSWWYDLSSPYEIVRKAWINQAKMDINVAEELGIKLLNFHFQVPSKILLENKKARNLILINYVNSLNILSIFAKNKGIALMLENGEEKFDYYKHVLDRTPQIKVHFDIGHAFISGRLKTIKNLVRYFNDRIAHIHIHDNHGIYDEHLALKKGKINWKRVVSILKRYHYDRAITFEVFKSNKDLIKSREYFRRLWND